MKKQISYRIVSLVFSVLVICFAIAFYVVAQWTEPGVGPPGGNVPAPLNTGLIDQVKEGALGIYGVFRAVGGADPAIEPGLVVNNGNVGIGTIDPSEKLEVVGNIKASGTICDSGGANCIGSGGGGLPSCTDGQILRTNFAGDWECQDDHTIIYETVTTSEKSAFFPACTSPLTIQTLSFSSQGGAIYIAGAAIYVHDGDTAGAGSTMYLYRDTTLLETIHNSFLQPGQQRRTSVIYTDFPGLGSYNYYLKGCSDAFGANDIKAKDRILMIEESLGK